MKLFGRFMAGVSFLVLSTLLAGCDTGPKYAYNPLNNADAPPPTSAASPVSTDIPDDMSGTLLQVGNTLTVSFSDTPTPVMPIDDTIKEDGTITLIYNQKFVAAGKTIGMLQEEIRSRYVPQYFKFLTVSIKNAQDRFFTVGGEVRAPGREPYVGKMTVLRAIDSAGGFTDFARKSHVIVIRADKRRIIVNCNKALENPDLDVEIFPGDQVNVEKRF